MKEETKLDDPSHQDYGHDTGGDPVSESPHRPIDNTPPRTKSQFTSHWSRVETTIRRLIAEAWTILITTAGKAAALILYVIAVCRNWRLRRRLWQTHCLLGEKLYDAGVGEQHIRDQIAAADDRILSLEAANGPTKAARNERKALLARLACSFDIEVPSACQLESEKALTARCDCERHDQHKNLLRATLFPKSLSEWLRVSIGTSVVVLGALLAFCLVIARDSHRTTGAPSDVLGAKPERTDDEDGALQWSGAGLSPTEIDLAYTAYADAQRRVSEAERSLDDAIKTFQPTSQKIVERRQQLEAARLTLVRAERRKFSADISACRALMQTIENTSRHRDKLLKEYLPTSPQVQAVDAEATNLEKQRESFSLLVRRIATVGSFRPDDPMNWLDLAEVAIEEFPDYDTPYKYQKELDLVTALGELARIKGRLGDIDGALAATGRIEDDRAAADALIRVANDCIGHNGQTLVRRLLTEAQHRMEKQSTMSDSSMVEVYAAIAESMSRIGDRSAADNLVQRAFKLARASNSQSTCLVVIGVTLARVDDIEGAKRVLHELTQDAGHISSQTNTVQLEIGLQCARKGSFEEVDRVVRTVVDSSCNTACQSQIEALCQIVLAVNESGDKTRARSIVTQAAHIANAEWAMSSRLMAQHPGDRLLASGSIEDRDKELHQIALTQAQLGDAAEAVAIAASISNRDENRWIAMRDIAGVLTAQGHLDKAKEVLKRAASSNGARSQPAISSAKETSKELRATAAALAKAGDYDAIWQLLQDTSYGYGMRYFDIAVGAVEGLRRKPKE